MFDECSSILTALGLFGFDTRPDDHMDSMFDRCHSLREVTVSIHFVIPSRQNPFEGSAS